MPIVIESSEQFNKVLDENKDKLVVVDWTATWCGPCQRIAPFFKELSEKYTDAVFLKVDVDANDKLAAEHGVAAMPTFFFFKNKEVVHKFSGASPDKLEAAVKSHI